jgi:hypothetical protein
MSKVPHCDKHKQNYNFCDECRALNSHTEKQKQALAKTHQFIELDRKVSLILEIYQTDDGEPLVADLAFSYVAFMDMTQSVLAELLYKQSLSQELFELVDDLFEEAERALPKLN